MKQTTLTFLLVLSSIIGWSQAINDECADRIAIAVTTGGINTYNIDTSTATESMNASCESSGNDNLDVWYEFTMPVDGNLNITGIPNTVTRSIFDTCGGTELACNSGSGLFYNLNNGVTYVLRIAENSVFAGNVTFNIQAFATAPNDECVNRAPITVATGIANTYATDTRSATESIDASCESSGNNNLDVWYEFTMPVNGNVHITGIPTTVTKSIFDSCSGIELSCSSGSGLIYSLSNGTTYVLRFAENAVFAGTVSFTIEAFEVAPNDECVNRTSISVTTGGALTYPTDSRTATESMDASCESTGNNNLDVWYEFTMPVNGNIHITGIPSTVTKSLFDSCGGTELACSVGTGFFHNLTQGTTYVLRIAENSVFAGTINTTIEAFEVAPNDECVDRMPITVATGGTSNYTIDFRTATESMDASCESTGNNNLDAWYEFTMPVNGNVHITGIPSTVTKSLFDSCGGIELECSSSTGFFFSLTQGITYVLRLAENSVFAGTVSFSIEAFEASPNNECLGATLVSIGVAAPTSIDFDNRGATESMDASCEAAGNINMDLWYEFTMPFDGDINITSLSTLTTISFFDACGGVELSCFSGSNTAFAFSGGASYYLRVSRTSAFANSDPFNIQALPSPLPTCSTTTEWISGSWNNGVPDISKNVVIRQNYDTAIEGSFSACSLAIDAGNTLFVRGGDYVEVAYGVNVVGTLDINHEGSLVQRDDASVTTNNGIIRVRKTTPFLKPRDLMLMGSPMDSETRTGVYNSAFLVLFHTTSNFVPHPDVAAQFPLAENFADDNGDNWTQYASGAINVGEGYIVRPQASYTDGNSTYDLVYTQGTLNNGVITVPILYNTTQNDSPNILGNPYASAISADDFINVNPQVDALYFWEHLTPPSPSLPGYNSINFSMEDLSIYNLMGGVAAASDPTGIDTAPNGYIASAQGFAIKANGAGTATFNNSMRRLSNNNTWRSSASAVDDVISEKNRLWLEVSNVEFELQNSTLIGFVEGASERIDPGYDSKRLANAVSLFSLAGNGEELGIQTREGFHEGIKISLGFSTMIDTETEYTISLKNIEGIPLTSNKVYLYDDYLKITTLLNDSTYSFKSSKASYLDRFKLFFIGEDRVLANEANRPLQLHWFPNPAKESISIVNTYQLEIKELKIFDIQGREVKRQNINSHQDVASISLSDIKSGMYLLTITTNKESITERLIKE
ncbi:MAG: T9SS type A sorting domain-containing protein [Flavobacteriaceae bacterium]|nr:T9SS type A sorting domain-containing protein [Flavobacteriaceae bacterium]